MESTSVEDFQDYHSRQPVVGIDKDLPSSPRPLNHSISGIQNHIDDDEASLSGSAHHSSGPDEAVFDHPTRASSPRTSNGSDDEISILESHYEPQHHTSSPFTPIKTHSAFRHPSSVRAMQMDPTPPHLMSPSSQQRHKLYTPSRQGTPHSTRSHRSTMSLGGSTRYSPTKKPKKEYPLVLLHVTLLPIPLVYSPQVMESVLPPSILENWNLLHEKATDTVLERGVLIPHPKEDYDLLEERLLESLELKTPRILKCGHFHVSPEEEADVLGSDTENEDSDAEDADICLDCGRRIRDGKYGSAGTGSKRWSIKLFAANGLMRAGAWSAAWREMERVDVEILPWMEEDMKRELELRREEEERFRADKLRAEQEEGVGGLDNERLRAIYGGDSQAFVDGFGEDLARTPQLTPRKQTARRQEDVPLWDLFRDYIHHAARDRRNIVIFLLSFVVLFLSLRSSAPPQRTDFALQTPSQSFPTPAAQFAQSGISAAVSKVPASVASAVSSSSSPSPEAVQKEETEVEASQKSPVKSEEQEEGENQGSSWIEAAEDVVGDLLGD